MWLVSGHRTLRNAIREARGKLQKLWQRLVRIIGCLLVAMRFLVCSGFLVLVYTLLMLLAAMIYVVL